MSNAKKSLVAGQSFTGLYPASNGEGMTIRVGTVEAIAANYTKVKVSNGYRTFTHDKLAMVGDSVEFQANTTGLGGGWQAVSGVIAEITENDIVLESGDVYPLSSIGSDFQVN